MRNKSLFPLLTFSLMTSSLALAVNSLSPQFKQPERTAEPHVHQKIVIKKGLFEIETRWTTLQQTSSEIDVLSGKVTFTPQPSAANNSCGAISFIQTAKILDNKKIDFEWPIGQSTRNKIRTKSSASGILPGFFIDHDASLCSATSKDCSPFYRDSWPNDEDGSQDGKMDSINPSPAVLLDYPFGWEVISSASLEACAVCRVSREILGCATWGGTWPTVGERTLHAPQASDTPSLTFNDALIRFQRFYKDAR